MNIFEMLYPRFYFDKSKPIRLFEAFSGVGCQAMALKRITDNIELVGFSEIDKYAIQSYTAIHGEVKNYGDITLMGSIPPCDIFTWSFPCTDLSKAGKQKGLDGTRSGLVYEVLRLLKATTIKPKVLIMENVIDLVQVKFVEAFNEIQRELEELGYTNYNEVLNAKDYGIPQNRERVFMVSILKDEENEHYSYAFPIKQELKLRLKDMLEDEVDEKYYLSSKALLGVINTTFQSSKLESRIEDENGVIPTLCASDYKDPKLVLVAQLDGYESSGRIYDENGLCPTINTMGGGEREPKIMVKSWNDDTKAFKTKEIDMPRDRLYLDESVGFTITTNASQMPFVAELRTDEGIRTFKDGLVGTLRTTESCGDKVVIEESVAIKEDTFVGKKYKEFYEEKGYIPDIFNPYNKSEIGNVTPTLTTQSGSTTASSSILIKEATTKGYAEAHDGDGGVVVKEKSNLKSQMCEQLISEGKVKENDVIRHSYTKSRMHGEMKDIQENNICPTLDTRADCLGVAVQQKARGYNKGGQHELCPSITSNSFQENNHLLSGLRIRKLTPLECWRLMGISDDDFNKVKSTGMSNSQLYKQAGNGIVVNVFEAILREMIK